jgi:hypothetical protein
MQLEYTTFLNNETEGSGKIKELIIYNPKTCVFPAFESEDLPTNVVKFEIPVWINKFEDLESLFLIGLYVNHLPKELGKLKKLKVLMINLPRDINIEELMLEIAELKSVKTIEISGSVISNNQYLRLKEQLKKIGIDVTDSMRNLSN